MLEKKHPWPHVIYFVIVFVLYLAFDINEGFAKKDLVRPEGRKEILLGSAAADVLQLLGSPDGIFIDEHNQESWVYNALCAKFIEKTENGWLFDLLKNKKQPWTRRISSKAIQLLLEFDNEYRLIALKHKKQEQ